MRRANDRFTPANLAGDAYWASKNLPADRRERMMAHYFDHDAWQDELNMRRQQGKKTTGRGRK